MILYHFVLNSHPQQHLLSGIKLDLTKKLIFTINILYIIFFGLKNYEIWPYSGYAKVLLYLSLKKMLAFAVKVPFSHPIVLPNSHLLALPSRKSQTQRQLDTI